VDDLGAYATDEHCGTCFASCEGLTVENGTVGCVVGATVACDEGLVPLNAFTCGEPLPVSCLPCADDGDCLGRHPGEEPEHVHAREGGDDGRHAETQHEPAVGEPSQQRRLEHVVGDLHQRRRRDRELDREEEGKDGQ
jgi:hypothetical protein